MNIGIPGFHPLVYDCSDTTHGGTGFYIINCIVYNKREDLEIQSPDDFESTSIELIFPNKKNLLIGCIYITPFQVPKRLMMKYLIHNKICALMGDFNIDLLKIDTMMIPINFSTHFFSPFVLQPTRLSSKTLIDNMFLKSIEYPSYSGNLTVQLSDHLFQFIILEGFYKELTPKRPTFMKETLKNFGEQEFNDIMKNTDWVNILMLGKNNPNLSMNNLHLHINNILDIHDPYKKLSKN